VPSTYRYPKRAGRAKNSGWFLVFRKRFVDGRAPRPFASQPSASQLGSRDRPAQPPRRPPPAASPDGTRAQPLPARRPPARLRCAQSAARLGAQASAKPSAERSGARVAPHASAHKRAPNTSSRTLRCARSAHASAHKRAPNTSAERSGARVAPHASAHSERQTPQPNARNQNERQVLDDQIAIRDRGWAYEN